MIVVLQGRKIGDLWRDGVFWVYLTLRIIEQLRKDFLGRAGCEYWLVLTIVNFWVGRGRGREPCPFLFGCLCLGYDTLQAEIYLIP
jgi:hypothetical protein